MVGELMFHLNKKLGVLDTLNKSQRHGHILWKSKHKQSLHGWMGLTITIHHGGKKTGLNVTNSFIFLKEVKNKRDKDHGNLFR